MMGNSKSQKLWTLTIFLFACLGGLVFQTKGALLESFQNTFQVSESLLGLVAPAGTISFMISILVFGMRTGRIDLRKSLLLGTALNTIFIFLIATSFRFSILLMFIFGQGLAYGIFRGIGKTVLSHIHPENRGKIFNFHDLMWAIGATLGPVTVSVLLKFGSWRLVYVLLAPTMIPVFILLSKLDLPRSTEGEESLSWDSLRCVLRHPLIVGMMTLLFFQGGVAGGMFTWLPYYASQFFSRDIANLTLSLYLAAFIPGRHFYGHLSERVGYLNTILLNTAIATLLLFFAFVLIDGYPKLIFIFSAGFFISGIFPTMVAKTTDVFPEFSGPMNAFAMSSSNLGLSIFPALIGVFAEVYSIIVAMRLLIVLLICVISVSYVSKRLSDD